MDYFFGDIHNMDNNIIMYEHRPFIDVQEMRDVIIHNWNKTIKNEDTIYLLGDIGDIEILKELKGNIVIILGNHDDYEELKKEYPNMEIYKHPIMVDGLWLSHEPIGYVPPECPYLNIHAHLHRFIYGLATRDWNSGNRYFCVSAEQINYKPISREEIKNIIKYKEV